MTRIELYDTTLRDGMQGEGMSLSAEEKLRIAYSLDELGIDVIEAGFPSSNPKELELFELLAGEAFQHAELAAFGMTRKRGVSAGDDPALRVLADCCAPVCTIVGKTWALHLEKVVKVNPEENLRMISESVAFLREQGKRVIYDAEHFFDAFSDDRSYALRCLQAAAEAGAETVVCCDTNGGTLPAAVAAAVAEVVAGLDGSGVQVGIHCHDDAGCGVADSLAAVAQGARQVQGTINGYGERCGNANLTTIIPNLQLKLGFECVTPGQLASLTASAHFFDELLNRMPNPNQPYVGRNAFAHKGGMHVAGVNVDPATFEHVDPNVVGNRRELLISELSGRGTVEARARQAGLELGEQEIAEVVERVKSLEHRGYQFEAADGSFELLLRRAAVKPEPLFELESWRVIVEQTSEHVDAEATVKIRVGQERFYKTAEGNGPVNALDKALRAALAEVHPDIEDIELQNFKVRIIDEAHGSDARTRVLIDVAREHETRGFIGVSENVIEASWQALVEALEYWTSVPQGAPAPSDTQLAQHP